MEKEVMQMHRHTSIGLLLILLRRREVRAEQLGETAELGGAAIAQAKGKGLTTNVLRNETREVANMDAMRSR